MAYGQTAASAKTQIIITPTAGPPGSSVHISGSGFCTGEVRIAATALNALPQGFVDKNLALPPAIELAAVASGSGGFEIDVQLPTGTEIEGTLGAQSALDIVAIHPGTEGCAEPDKTFLIGQPFTLTEGLPGTGTGAVAPPVPSLLLLSIGIGMIGALLLAASALTVRRR